MKRKTFAVDWDGVMVEYSGYRGVGVFGAPVPSMVDRVKMWLDHGHEVIIFTSRVSIEHTIEDAVINTRAIHSILQTMGLPELEVTSNKYARVSEFWDDRAVRVMRNTGNIGHEDLGIVRRA